MITTVVLPVALAVIMLSLGLALTPADFRRVLVLPRGIAIGMLNLALISPLLAFGIAAIFSLPPELAVGLVILGASPGGTMANMLTHLAKGDTALSITMTAISSLAAIVTVPLFLGLARNAFDANDLGADVSMVSVVARVFLITLIPIAVGMTLRRRWPTRVLELRPLVSRLAMAVFVLVVIGAIISESERVLAHFTEVAGAALALNVAAMAAGFGISKLARLDDRQATAISIELGMHNATLAIAVAASISAELTIPAAVYSTFMFVTAGGFARFMHQRNAAIGRPQAPAEVAAAATPGD